MELPLVVPVAASCEKRSAVIDFILKATVDGIATPREVVAFCLRGSSLWSVERIADRGAHRVVLMEYTLHRRDGTWAYEVRSETNGPHGVSCPLGYLEMVPERNAAWRDRVREHHARPQPSSGIAEHAAAEETWVAV